MATQEFYIRNATETEARGPYSLSQLTSLAEAGQVTAETLYYDANNEQWIVIGDDAELKATLFPEKKKLTLKAKEFKPLNKENESAPPITVDQMLAAAEGRTDETADKQNPEIAAARAAKIGMWSAIAALAVNCAGEVVPSASAIMAMDIGKIAGQPLVFLGAVDLVLALLLSLGTVSLYPFVRFRAMLGLGFVGFLFFVHGVHLPLLALIGASVGLYLCTIFVVLVPVLAAAGLAIGGGAAVAWHLLSS